LTATSELLVAVLSAAGLAPGTSEQLTRAADILRRHVCVAVAQPLVVVRQQEIVAVLPTGRARANGLAKHIRAAHGELTQRGEPWAGGISTVCAGISEARRGYDEARQARDWAHADAGVVALLEARVSDYLLQRADATAQRMIPAAARRLFESVAPADRVLVETLLAYVAADMAVRITAERISVHPNTVTYRLDKVRQLLGRDPTRYSDLVELLTWARLLSC
jgi:DNA-binding PucR family transcriptional regulator